MDTMKATILLVLCFMSYSAISAGNKYDDWDTEDDEPMDSEYRDRDKASPTRGTEEDEKSDFFRYKDTNDLHEPLGFFFDEGRTEGVVNTFEGVKNLRDSAKPDGGTKTDDGKQPDTDAPAEPSDGVKPGTGTKPNDDTQTGGGEKPHDGTKPDDGTKTDDGTNPDTGAKPDDGTIPGTGAKPDTGTKPGDSAKPDDGTKPDTNTKPNNVTTADDGAKPSDEKHKEPDALEKPNADAEPRRGSFSRRRRRRLSSRRRRSYLRRSGSERLIEQTSCFILKIASLITMSLAVIQRFN